MTRRGTRKRQLVQRALQAEGGSVTPSLISAQTGLTRREVAQHLRRLGCVRTRRGTNYRGRPPLWAPPSKEASS